MVINLMRPLFNCRYEIWEFVIFICVMLSAPRLELHGFEASSKIGPLILGSYNFLASPLIQGHELGLLILSYT